MVVVDEPDEFAVFVEFELGIARDVDNEGGGTSKSVELPVFLSVFLKAATNKLISISFTVVTSK